MITAIVAILLADFTTLLQSILLRIIKINVSDFANTAAVAHDLNVSFFHAPSDATNLLSGYAEKSYNEFLLSAPPSL